MLDAMPGGGDAHLELLDDAGEVIGLATIRSRSAHPDWRLRDMLEEAIAAAGFLDIAGDSGAAALPLHDAAGELIGEATVISSDARFPVGRLAAILAAAWRATVTQPQAYHQ